MRIALVAPLVSTIAQPYIGGAQAMLADLAQGLQRRGHAVTLFARAGSLVPGISIEAIDVPEQVLPARFSGPAQERPTDHGFFVQANLFLDLFLRLQQRHEFDLFHAHAFDWPAYVESVLLCERPVVHTLHLPALSPEINEALRVLHQRGHPLTLVTISRACARTYDPYTSIDQIVYNGIDLSIMPFSPSVPADAPLLFAGRIAPEKGVEDAIEIAERANRHLLIAGGIYDQQYYTERIAPRLARARDHSTYLGQLTHAELWNTMSQSLGLLFPSTWNEPFGLVAIEALATGTPVIAYRHAAIEELLRNGETGFLVDVGEHAQAATLVESLATLSRTTCRLHVEQHFSLERMLDGYEQLYTKILNQ